MADGEDLYLPAPDVKKVADVVIAKIYDNLLPARITYLFRTKPAMKRGRTVLVEAKKASSLQQFMNRCDFILIVNQDEWSGQSNAWKEALVDFGLAHFNVQKTTKKDKETGEDYDVVSYSLNPYDIEDFTEVSIRRGSWTVDRQFYMEGITDPLRNILESRADMDPDDFVESLVSAAEAVCGITREEEDANTPSPA